MAVDRESGDATFATVVVEVLSEGQSSEPTLTPTDNPINRYKHVTCVCVCTSAVPYSPLGDDRAIGCTIGKAFFLSMVFMTGFSCLLCLVMWLKKKHKGGRDPLERGCVAQGKHPNVVSQLIHMNKMTL